VVLKVLLELVDGIFNECFKNEKRLQITTRSQAVARIADRTAKNCKGHVTVVT